MEKLMYDAVTTKMIRQITSGLSEKFNVDMRFIEQHNESCPGCDEPFKKHNKIVSGVGAVVSFVPSKFSMGIAVPFCLCKTCYKSRTNPVNNVRNKAIDSIIGKLL